MARPKIDLLYYKSVLDKCLLRFFGEHGEAFTKGDGAYVYSGGLSASALERMFLSYAKDEIGKYVAEFRESSPEYLFIIGSCIPAENVALERASGSAWLRKLVERAPDIRYFLRECDIKVDMRLFNDVFERVFLRFMDGTERPWRNVFFVRSRRLDCYFTFKAIKERFGSMAVNLHKRHALGEDRCIYSVNEEIDGRCPKREMLASAEMEPLKRELWRYVETCIKGA